MKMNNKKINRQVLRDTGMSAIILGMSVFVCIILSNAKIEDSHSDSYSLMIFMLAVFLISRFTHGRIYGIVSSVMAVICVNYFFTYPYFAFDFTLPGYPLTFIVMLVTSLITSTMTMQIKHQHEIKAEAENEKMRGNLLRAVSHDLRTPLTSIVGATSAVLDNEEVLTLEKKRELLEEVKNDAQWLIRMVENLLSITRINGGDTKIIKSEEAAEEIISDSVAKFKKRFPEATVSVTVPDELIFVPMDPILIGQVLINLLENALIHGKRNDGIYVLLERTGDYASFFVRDHGVGIPEGSLKNLFSGHIEGETENSGDKKKNMGIGLSVCKTIVEAHGGEMTAENIPRGGCVFKFTLPITGDEN